MNKMLSKEEIEKIDKAWYSRNPVHEINTSSGEDMFDGTMRMCMSEYAEQEAIAFAEWLKDNNYTKGKDGWYKYYTQVKEFGNFAISTPVYEYLTIEQLYKIYQQSKPQQP